MACHTLRASSASLARRRRGVPEITTLTLVIRHTRNAAHTPPLPLKLSSYPSTLPHRRLVDRFSRLTACSSIRRFCAQGVCSNLWCAAFHKMLLANSDRCPALFFHVAAGPLSRFRKLAPSTIAEYKPYQRYSDTPISAAQVC
jgi:hypothetical protein